VVLSIAVLTAWASRARRGPPAPGAADAEPGAAPTTVFEAPAEPGGGVAVSEPPGAKAQETLVVREVANDSPRDRSVVVALAVLAVALVGLAAAVESYVPLFLVWAPQVAVLAWVSRGGRTGAPPVTSGAEPPERAVEEGEGTVPAR
jgi:hypothetical protein